MSDKLYVDLEPVSVGTGLATAQVISGQYVAISDSDDPDVYDLFEIGPDDEPMGNPVGRMRKGRGR